MFELGRVEQREILLFFAATTTAGQEKPTSEHNEWVTVPISEFLEVCSSAIYLRSRGSCMQIRQVL